jgi:hypothetical protein
MYRVYESIPPHGTQKYVREVELLWAARVRSVCVCVCIYMYAVSMSLFVMLVCRVHRLK